MADEVREAVDKRDQIKPEKLLRELNKIEQVERSDMRMLETARHRFRSKLKRFQVPQLSSGSDAVDVRMYDTHNPGFCYHCTGAIRASDTSSRKNVVDSFHVVHSMLFTNGEVDPDKVLCLHVLAAHCAKSASDESLEMIPITPLIEKGRQENFSGLWNSILPCYVMDIQQTVDDGRNFPDDTKRHKDPLVVEAEEEMVKEFQCKYKKYLEENSDVGLAISTNNKRTKMAPNGIGKMTIIPAHVYSLLGAAQELKIKQAIAEESRRKKFRRSSSSIKNVDVESISFRLEDEDDVVSRQLMTATSIRGWNGNRIIGTSKISGFQCLSRRSVTSSHRTEPSITTLKRASPRSSEFTPLSVDLDARNATMGRTGSKTSSTKSPFRNFSSLHGPGCPGSISIMSGMSSLLGEPRKIRRPIFINAPVKSHDLKNRDYKTVPILVNNQMQALVHSVLDVLDRVNPSKMRKIVSTANSPYEIRRMLSRPDIQLFIDSLAGQPLITSPDSFVISMASIIYEIDPRDENSIERELVATTLDVPPTPSLHRLIHEIRNNLFVDPVQAIGSKAEIKIETISSQKQKLFGSKSDSRKVSDQEKDVFDVETSCLHSDFQGTRMTCAYCYAKWKDSLPDIDRSKVPDFSFLVSRESELTPENLLKYETNNCQIIGDIKEEEPRDGHGSETKKQPRGISSSIDKSSRQKKTPEIEKNISVTKPKGPHHSSNQPLRKGALPKACRPIGLKTSEKSSPRNSPHYVDRKSRLSKKTSGHEIPDKPMRVRAKLARSKISVDEIKEARSYKGSSILGLPADCHSVIGTSQEKPWSKITLDDAPSPKCQFKPWKASQNPSYLEPDCVILRRMTNSQRILVGQMCASLKTRRINLEGLVKERTPLAAFIAPVLSLETLRVLTKGMRQDKSRKREMSPERDDCVTIASQELTGAVLVKVQQAVAENETNRRLASFLESSL